MTTTGRLRRFFSRPRQSREQRLLHLVGELSLAQGVVVGFPGEWRIIPPKDAPDLLYCQKAAEHNVEKIAETIREEGYRRARQVIRKLRRENTLLVARTAALASIEQSVLAAERGAALTELIRLDFDADPAFTAVAAASTPNEVRLALLAARRRLQERERASLMLDAPSTR
ncbi:hypothetical protein [Microbacterium sp. 77mftsu3.1]|uniref:hypothetical protein n=1 Tax=Microbacterium sp. 77mftsu3.1 TaxID=1761802 RepID=UPI000371727E|nr:hypothetical protein [Microbacterium sp. 77mftsu3.1]SDH33845.1 hypothetical protein SAMN04488590_3067 [Microbacterium sp. 77mftsu3.1]